MMMRIFGQQDSLVGAKKKRSKGQKVIIVPVWRFSNLTSGCFQTGTEAPSSGEDDSDGGSVSTLASKDISKKRDHDRKMSCFFPSSFIDDISCRDEDMLSSVQPHTRGESVQLFLSVANISPFSQGINVFSMAKIFIPVPIDDKWGLIVATMQSLRGKRGSGSLIFKDLGVSGPDARKQHALQITKEWLQREADKLHTPFDVTGWTVAIEKATICCGIDSGVVLIAYVEFMKLDLPICFGEGDIDHFRYRFSLQVFSSVDKTD
jgi:hypothetical protein